MNRHADRLAGCFPWDAYTDLVVFCGEDDLAALPAGGYLGAAVAQLRRDAAADATAGDALALLYRLARTEAR